MKILFLDIDGVLNSRKTWGLYGNSCPMAKDQKFNLDPTTIRFLQLLHAKGIEIVVSSTWRLHKKLGNFKDVFGFAVKGITCSYPFKDSKRGDEIAVYLKEHPEIESYCIVDDDTDVLDDQMPNFVRTSYEDGMSYKHMVKICEVLGFSFFDLLPREEKEVEGDFSLEDLALVQNVNEVFGKNI